MHLLISEKFSKNLSFENFAEMPNFVIFFSFISVRFALRGMNFLFTYPNKPEPRKNRFIFFCSDRMPKKKTGARKKAEKQAERQRDIRSSDRGLAIHPCNQLMG